MNGYSDEVRHNTSIYLMELTNNTILKELSTDTRLSDEDRTEIERAAKQYGLNPYQKNLFYGSRLFEGETFGTVDHTKTQSTKADILGGSLRNYWGRWAGDKNVSFINRFAPSWSGVLTKEGKPFPASYYKERGVDTLRSDMNMAPTLRIMMHEGTDEDRYMLEQHTKGKSGFNPEGKGFDMENALMSGSRLNAGGHWGSLDPRTGMVLKGRGHETWNLMVEEEKKLGNVIIKKSDGRYYSVKETR